MWCRANDLKTVVRFGLVCKRVGCLPKPVDCKYQEMAHGILHTVAERIKGGHAIRSDAVSVVKRNDISASFVGWSTAEKNSRG